MTTTLRTSKNLDNFVAGSPGVQDDVVTLQRLRTLGGVAIQITGTWAGTITFEALVDGTADTWVAFNMTPSNSGTDASTTTGNGAWSKQNTGYAAVRARWSTKTSGTPVIAIRAVQQGV